MLSGSRASRGATLSIVPIELMIAEVFWLALGAGLVALVAYQFWRAVRDGARNERILLVLGGGFVLAACLVPASVGYYHGAEPEPIFITGDWIVWTLLGLSATAFISLGFSAGTQHRRNGVWAALLALLVGGPFTGCARFLRNPAPWVQYGALDHPNGQRYAFLNSSFMQGQLLVIARIESTHWYGTRYTGLVLTNGDSPRYYISIVRPNDQATGSYGQLLLTPDERILAVRSSNRVYMAYDPHTGKRWAHGDIYTLSPFVALDADAVPSEGDIDLTLAAMRESLRREQAGNVSNADVIEHEPISGVPAVPLLQQAEQHPNPAVRGAAQRLLAAWRAQSGLRKTGASKPAAVGGGSE